MIMFGPAMTRLIATAVVSLLIVVGLVEPFSAPVKMRTVVVTGADGGIGRSFCNYYAKQGDRVFACRRKSSPEASKLFDHPNIKVVDGVDVTQDEGVDCLIRALNNDDRNKEGEAKVDILINNAGSMIRSSKTPLDLDPIRESMEINAYGALRVTGNLLGRRLFAPDGAKVALITSKMGSMADNTSGGAYPYRMSKAALNAAGVSLAHDLQGSDIAVAILHPGWVRTRMTKGSGLIDSDESVAGMAARIEELNLGSSGTFWGYAGDVIPW